MCRGVGVEEVFPITSLKLVDAEATGINIIALELSNFLFIYIFCVVFGTIALVLSS